MKSKFRKGWVYQIEFLDHVEDGDEPIPFRVYGPIVKQDKKSLTVAPWVNLDQTVDHNSKTFCILKSTILNADRLIPESAIPDREDAFPKSLKDRCNIPDGD